MLPIIFFILLAIAILGILLAFGNVFWYGKKVAEQFKTDKWSHANVDDLQSSMKWVAIVHIIAGLMYSIGGIGAVVSGIMWAIQYIGDKM